MERSSRVFVSLLLLLLGVTWSYQAVVSRQVLENHNGPHESSRMLQRTKKSNEIADMVYLDRKFDQAAMAFGEGRLKEALSLAETAAEGRREMLGAEHEDTLHAITLQAVILRKLGHLEEALSLQEEVVSSLSRHMSQLQDPDYLLIALNNKAITLGQMGQLTEALSLLEQVLKHRKLSPGEETQEELSELHSKAYLLSRLGRLGEAEELFARVAERRAATLGPEDPLTLHTMQYYAETLGQMGRADEALQICQRVLHARRSQLGERHEETRRAERCVANMKASSNEVRAR